MRKIAFITDTHFDEQFTLDALLDARKNWEIILDDLQSRKITELIIGGDIGNATSHKYFFESLKDYSFHLLLGNHDSFIKLSKFHNSKNTTEELYYSFEDEYYRYIFLDTSSYKVSEKQLTWLTQELRTHKKILIFIHHPILEVKTIVDKNYPLKNRKQIKNILESIKKPVTVFCGHYHTNDEQIENNIRQIITQSASYQFEKNINHLNILNSEFGYRIIEIEQNNIRTKLVTFIN
ncbi:MAG: metallophosphoesterase family protein [Jejuia sp.]